MSGAPEIVLQGRVVKAQRPLRLVWARYVEALTAARSDSLLLCCTAAAVALVYPDRRWGTLARQEESVAALGAAAHEVLVGQEGWTQEKISEEFARVVEWVKGLLNPEVETAAGNSSAPPHRTGGT